MSRSQPFQTRVASFANDWQAIRQVREAVFVIEQKVPATVEWTGDDDQYWHVLAEDDQDRPIGTGRLSVEGKIGRMAVLKAWRGQSVGASILRQLIEVAQQNGIVQLKLSAQVTAIDFYSRYGFEAVGEIFMEAGLAHRWMQRAGQLPFE